MVGFVCGDGRVMIVQHIKNRRSLANGGDYDSEAEMTHQRSDKGTFSKGFGSFSCCSFTAYVKTCLSV